MQRIILHVDLDSFYAQAEELRKPELAGKPVVVGMYSGRTETSGAVATANYAARALGIRSGMALGAAKEKASEDTVFLRADRPYYLQVSGRVMEVLRTFADARAKPPGSREQSGPVFEQVSIDEASLDVSERCSSFEKAEALAKRLKAELKQRERLTCSVGVGPNKLIAKMAASARKPDGLTVVKPADVDGFLEPLPAGKLYGLGPKSESALAEIGVKTVRELKRLSLEKLRELFGDARGQWFYNAARGVDESAVQEEPQKQLSRLATLKKDGASVGEIWPTMEELASAVAERAERFGIRFRNIGILIVTPEQESLSRSASLREPTGERAVLLRETKRLLEEFLKERPVHVRRVGVRVAGFAHEGAGLKKWLS